MSTLAPGTTVWALVPHGGLLNLGLLGRTRVRTATRGTVRHYTDDGHVVVDWRTGVTTTPRPDQITTSVSAASNAAGDVD